MSIHHPVSGVDDRSLTDCDVLRLRFSNAKHGLELAGLNDSPERGAGIHPLPGLESEILEHAFFARAHDKCLHTILLKVHDCL